MCAIFLRPKGEVSWADANYIHDFPSQVICLPESVPTDADLTRGERIASGMSKPYLLYLFLFRQIIKCFSEIPYNTAQICANLQERQRKTHPLEG